MINKMFRMQREKLKNALNGKKVVYDINNSYTTKCTKAEADEIIEDLYDDAVFQCGQFMESCLAYEAVCRDLLRQMGRNEDDVYGLYIEQLQKNGMNQAEDIAQSEVKEKRKTKHNTVFTLIKGGISV